jgi:hypothetical protein
LQVTNLQVENLLFWQEVERFRSIVKLHANRLYASFISEAAGLALICSFRSLLASPAPLIDHAAVNQVNIDAKEATLIHSCLTNPSAMLFDQAQKEVLHLMVRLHAISAWSIPGS